MEEQAQHGSLYISEATTNIGDWLRLIRAPGIGARTAHRLLTAIGDPAAIFRANDEKLLPHLRQGRRQLTHLHTVPDPELIKNDLAWLESEHHHLVTYHHPRYPALLKEIAVPPVALFVNGCLEVLNQPQLAIVGSRNPTPAGRNLAGEFAADLGRQGLVITSGLATGIDRAAHLGALNAESATVAVCATGLDRVYPAHHRELASKIHIKGALISEFPTGTAPQRDHFPRRNRLISGLSLGTLVVEATLRSGSLITARLSAEQNREVFAVPGPIRSQLSQGCHALIRDGAKLVATIDDILEELPDFKQKSTVAAVTPDRPLPPRWQSLFSHLDYQSSTVDELVARSGLTPSEVCSMLLEMEIGGLVASLPGGGYQRC